MGTATKVVGYIFGILILLGGLFFFAFGLSQPMLFAGQYLILGIIIIIFGFVIMYLGHRSGRKKQTETTS
jgi:membrane protein implicated in regulation of membrane protease activity